MKKLLGLVVLSGLVLTGCGNSAPKDEKLVDQIKERGTLVIANELAYSPYNWVIKDQTVPAGYEDICTLTSQDTVACGVDIAVGLEIAKEMGVKLDVVAYEWDGLIPAMKKGDFDIIVAGMSPTAKRKKQVDFTDIYLVADDTLLVDKDSTITNIKDLDGKKVGVQIGTIQATACKDQIEGAECIELDDYNTLLMDLKAGRLDTVIADAAVAQVQVAQSPELKMVSNVGFKEVDPSENGSAIAVRRGNVQLEEYINKVLERLNTNNQTRSNLEKAAQLLAENLGQ